MEVGIQMIVTEYPNLISKSICDDIIDMASPLLYKARVSDKAVEGYRVAENCWLDFLGNSHLENIISFISKETSLPIDNQEGIHIVRYKVGGEYKEHYDWFDFHENQSNVRLGGNRTHSFLIYLNDDFEGGETKFPKLQKTIIPKLGKGVMWLNKLDGKCLEEALHAGLPVTKGEKWILIVWVREKSLKVNKTVI